MNFRRHFKFAAMAIAMMAFAQLTYAQTAGDGKIANLTVGASSVRWDILVPNSGGSVTVLFPDGRSIRKAFHAGSAAEVDLSDKQIEGLPDGVYNYEVRLAPSMSSGQKEIVMKARGDDDDSEAQRNLRKRPVVPSLSQSGSFAIVNGSIVGPGAFEGERTGTNSVQPLPTTKPAPAARVSENTVTRLRNHRFSLGMMPDVVFADDVIVQGSLCVGLDCVNNESFGFDTIRLKENNTRIKFDDTSTSAGFPNHDWQLTANDSGSGGANKFSIEDITAATVPMTITGSAPTNSLFVASTGKIGNGTSTPVLNFHITATDTPAIRQEQTSGGGFTAQTWDIGANEANWFVRDVTGGSRLPFRIRPGAPTSSIDISASGSVGMGIASPAAPLHLFATTTNFNPTARFSDNNSTLGTMTLIEWRAGTANNKIHGIAADSNGLAFYRINDAGTGFISGTPDLAIVSSGRVGVGTASPDQLLSVNGDASKSGGGSWQTFSDARLKNIKGRFNLGLQAVMQLQPLRYEYKPDNALGLKMQGERIGFAAQELQRVIPEAVTKGDSGYLMVNNDPILWTMLNAIKEQQQEIVQLKKEITRLRTNPARRHRK